MKQIVQNYKQKTLTIADVPVPTLKPGGVLVQSYHSLISAGTEKRKVDDAQKSVMSLARSHPDKVKQVFDTFKQQGPMTTFRKVMNRLDSLTPLGYSLAGKIVAVAEDVREFCVGDWVSCAGAEIANHAEINWIPVNLCCKIPKIATKPENSTNGYLPTDVAAFATVGAIAMQGVRQAEVSLGENVAVIGLGLVGLLSCTILKAAGCNVFGFDIDERKMKLAHDIGVDLAVTPGSNDIVQTASSFSGGFGMDAVLITTGTQSNEPIELAGMIARDRGIVVDVGINKMDVPWKLYYSKELILKQSRSYGPGRYDPSYEMKGQDYPIGYVRWTEKRNMMAFLDLCAKDKVTVTPLVTHRFSFANAKEAYDIIQGGANELYVGILLEYDVNPDRLDQLTSSTKNKSIPKPHPGDGLSLGVIGAGNFARSMLLPLLTGNGVHRIGVATARGISAQDTADKFGFQFCTTDYKELLEHPQINTVLIATRHHLHGRFVAESLKAGKNVYTEKPLCLKIEELDTIAGFHNEAVRQNKPCFLMVGFNRRFSRMMQDMKSFFRNRQDPMIITCRVNAGPMKDTDWYQDEEIGGGRIIGEVCHFVDCLQFMSDANPVTLFAQTIQTGNRSIRQEDNVIITLELSDGSIGSITYSANGDSRFPKEYMEVFCENKVAVMNNFSTLTTMTQGKKHVQRSVIQEKGHKGMIHAFVSCIQDGKPSPISFDSLHATTRTCFRIRESIRQKQLVQVDSSEH